MTHTRPGHISSANHTLPPNGFTMVEVLVSLFVLAIGLLGLAALQTVGLKYNHQSYQQTQATALTYDIVDKMRANSLAVVPTNQYLLSTTSTPPSISTDCSTTSCSPASMAAYDLNHWMTNVTRLLAGGSASIQTAGTGLYNITISWTDPNSGTMKSTTTVQLP